MPAGASMPYKQQWVQPNLFVLLLKRLPPIQNLIQQHAIGIYIAGLGGDSPPQQLRCPPVGGLVPLPVHEQLGLFWRLHGRQNRGWLAVGMNALRRLRLMLVPVDMNDLENILLCTAPVFAGSFPVVSACFVRR